MQSGTMPDVNKVLELADELIQAESEWQTMLTRMRLASDFQAREYFKLTSAWAEKRGSRPKNVGVMMKWQADNMKAFAMGMPPLAPPPGIDLEKLAKATGADEWRWRRAWVHERTACCRTVDRRDTLHWA